MPKYYRFRPTSPNRKPKRKDKEPMAQDIERFKLEVVVDCLGISGAFAPAMKWYLRRISWRDNLGLMTSPRQQNIGVRSPVQITNQGIGVPKNPTELSQDWTYFF